MSFDLKDYQQRCLDTLGAYFRRAREVGAQPAFDERSERELRYRTLPGWPASAALPYVCIRAPTGGGKTTIAAHAVGVAAKTFLQAERALVLWLAPSGAIVEQTLGTLRDRRHSNRAALDEAFGGCVTVLDVDEALSLRPGTLDFDSTIIVATMQTFRVTRESDRRVYKSNGELLDHFLNLDERQAALLERTDADGNVVAEGGAYARSLANVLRLRRPLVIVDEAHNAKSELSSEVYERLNPAALVEFTATPAPHTRTRTGSNVLFSVAAAELKAAHMIKLPIRLVERHNPPEAISAALAKREELERLATVEEQAGGPYIRPIVLFHAESRREGEERLTPDVLKELLLRDFEIPAGQIAIRTGQLDELPDDPLRRDCPLRYVITINALREGWDCPFAYVLCSVANLSARGAVEQLLGRILRLPYAQERATDALNQAYAYAATAQFGSAVESLRGTLVDSGFEPYEAQAAVVEDEPLPRGRDGGTGALFAEPVAEIITAAPPAEAVATLPPAVRETLAFQRRADTGETELVWTGGAMPPDRRDALLTLFERADDRRAVERVWRRSWGAGASPAGMGDRLIVPRLALPDPTAPQGWSLFDAEGFDADWNLDDCDAALGPDALDPARVLVSATQLDVDAEGRLRIKYLEQFAEQMQLRDLRGPKTAERLLDWLDAEIPVPEVVQAEKRAFLERVLAHLIAQRRLTLETLLPLRWRLVAAVDARINNHRVTARTRTYQAMLLPDCATPLQCRPEIAFEFPTRQGRYAAASEYNGSIELRKHFYENIAAMNNEEARCAAIIAGHSNVEYWVRNLTAGPFAFSLPLATQRFYPDFVAKLRDGRIAVIEYKGEGGLDRRETEEKDLLGHFWASRPGSNCVFELVGAEDMHGRLQRALVSAAGVG